MTMCPIHEETMEFYEQEIEELMEYYKCDIDDSRLDEMRKKYTQAKLALMAVF